MEYFLSIARYHGIFLEYHEVSRNISQVSPGIREYFSSITRYHAIFLKYRQVLWNISQVLREVSASNTGNFGRGCNKGEVDHSRGEYYEAPRGQMVMGVGVVTGGPNQPCESLESRLSVSRIGN